MRKIIIALLLSILISCSQKPSNSDVISVSKEFIKQELVAPATAVFPSNDQIQITRDKGDSTFHVSSFVDAQNSFSANVRTEWELHLWYIGGKFSDIKSWVLLKE
jgi:hypothetical protein